MKTAENCVKAERMCSAPCKRSLFSMVMMMMTSLSANSHSFIFKKVHCLIQCTLHFIFLRKFDSFMKVTPLIVISSSWYSHCSSIKVDQTELIFSIGGSLVFCMSRLSDFLSFPFLAFSFSLSSRPLR